MAVFAARGASRPPGWTGSYISRPAHRGSIEKREELFIHPTAKIRFIVTTALDEGANHEPEDKACLGRLTGFEPGVVSAGFGIGIAVNPLAIVTVKLSETIIPVRTEGQPIAYEGTHDGTRGAILDDLIRHLRLLYSLGKQQRLRLPGPQARRQSLPPLLAPENLSVRSFSEDPWCRIFHLVKPSRKATKIVYGTGSSQYVKAKVSTWSGGF
jgi:hypothetical protein